MDINNIKNKFNNIATEYDKERRSLISCFDDFYGIAVDMLQTEKAEPTVIDLGAGTGLLSQFILLKYPNAKITLVDVSDKMLEMAHVRFSDNKNISYVVSDYANYKFPDKYDFIVSALSIHHLTNEQKAGLYLNCYEALNVNGCFVNADQFIFDSKENDQLVFEKWKQRIEASPLSEDNKKGAFERMKLDKPATVEENLEWLKIACFRDVDLFYKYYNFGVIVGRRY
jgi:tRNA (cmo5U34)-methyltransferase